MSELEYEFDRSDLRELFFEGDTEMLSEVERTLVGFDIDHASAEHRVVFKITGFDEYYEFYVEHNWDWNTLRDGPEYVKCARVYPHEKTVTIFTRQK